MRVAQSPKPIEPGVYPVILEPQAVADLIGLPDRRFDARTADEGRSAFSAKDGKTRVGEALFSERLNLYSDPMHAEMPARRHGEGDSGVAAVAGQGRRGREPRIRASGPQEKKREPTPGPVNYILESTQPPGRARRDDQGHGARAGDLALLVRAPDRSAHDDADRPDARRPVVGREGHDPVSGAQPALQPERARCWRRGTWSRSARRSAPAKTGAPWAAPVVVPALKVRAFNFTSLSEAV